MLLTAETLCHVTTHSKTKWLNSSFYNIFVLELILKGLYLCFLKKDHQLSIRWFAVEVPYIWLRAPEKSSVCCALNVQWMATIVPFSVPQSVRRCAGTLRFTKCLCSRSKCNDHIGQQILSTLRVNLWLMSSISKLFKKCGVGL